MTVHTHFNDSLRADNAFLSASLKWEQLTDQEPRLIGLYADAARAHYSRRRDRDWTILWSRAKELLPRSDECALSFARHRLWSALHRGHALDWQGIWWPGSGKPICSPACDDQVEAVIEWVFECAAPRKSFNKAANSYRVKHLVRPGKIYCSNGAVLEAVIRLGIRYRPTPDRDKNAYLAIDSPFFRWAK